ncbi:polysaccharide biosynthesis protein [Bacillus sp. FJAT-45037]|uniref:polysaccharide biosynthesis protein n=1 Tax=Bacillus sp. FJAT-45037 TaxID=2011007 RepID=UPI000C248332|nr:polysaccharide biosynthesis protein [Bacillus sp. FJAT-45037]
MNTFLKGAILLILVAFIGECLEFLINMILARELGEEGLGMYMSILPTVMFVVVIASLELPISISKFVAEKEPIFHRNMLHHAIRFAMFSTILFVVIAFVILPVIPVFDRYHPATPFLFIVLIPIIAFSSVARGYFMGAQDMSKIAIANFLRRAGHLLLLVFVFTVFSFDLETAIFVSLSTLIITEMVVLLYLMVAFYWKMNELKRHPQAKVPGKNVRRTLLQVSLPTTGLRIFHAASFAVKPFLIKTALVRGGMVDTMAMIQYGKLAGVAFTIGFFPAFIAHSLLIVLIPAVSESYAKGDIKRLQKLLRRVMFTTFAYGFPAVYIFYFYAEPLTSLFFDQSPAAGYLQLLVPYFLFHYFVMPMQAYLIGLGLVKEAFWHAVWATTISFILMYVLGSRPELQMGGIIIGMNMGAVLLTLMHYVTITKKLGLTIWMKTEQ